MAEIARLIAGGLFALICSYIGLQIKGKYRARETFYTDASEFVSRLASELNYKKTVLPEIISSFTLGRKGALATLLGDYSAEMRSKGKFERNPTEWEIAHLKLEEKKELLSFLTALGQTGLSDQLALAERYGSLFEMKRQKAVDETKRLGGMYFKLLVLLGLAVLVILA